MFLSPWKRKYYCLKFASGIFQNTCFIKIIDKERIHIFPFPFEKMFLRKHFCPDVITIKDNTLVLSLHLMHLKVKKILTFCFLKEISSRLTQVITGHCLSIIQVQNHIEEAWNSTRNYCLDFWHRNCGGMNF